MIRMIIKIDMIIVHEVMFLIKEVRGKGSRMVISTSKIKKMIAIRKNRRENGIRLDEKGSNPHSNGDDFSRLVNVFFLSIEAVSAMMVEINSVVIDAMMIGIIISLKVLNLVFGRHPYLFYTREIETSSVNRYE